MTAWRVAALALSEWSHHRAGRMGAALAYYSVFSMGPLLLIIVSVAGLFFGSSAAQGELIAQFHDLLGETGGRAVEAMLVSAGSTRSGWLAATVGFVLTLLAAIAIVVQLKDALNTIWNVADAEEPAAWWYIRTYASALAAILALGFLLAVSLVLTAATALLADRAGMSSGHLVEAINFAVSFAALTLLFAMIFKWFPDTDVAWGDVWIGAAATALLFTVGKIAIAWYVGSQALESTYGAAASLVVLLLWVYYSAQILLFGAELTHAYAHLAGSRAGLSTRVTSPHRADRK